MASWVEPRVTPSHVWDGVFCVSPDSNAPGAFIGSQAPRKTKEESKMSKKDQYFIMSPDGSLSVVDADVQMGSEEFWGMVSKEALRKDYEPLAGEPAYASICRKLGIAWEEMSDSGHMRYGPRGALLFDLLADYCDAIAKSLNLPLCQVKGTNMFNLDEGPIAEHAELFGDRLYSLSDPDSGRSYVLRYAACHQQFAMIKHWQISYKHLPFAAYELADSYRLEQSGECMLGFRSRRLNMPDIHVLCAGAESSAEWFLMLHERIMKEARDFGQSYELLVNVSSPAALEQNLHLLQQVSKRLSRPILIHQYPGDRNYYWTVNAEYHIIDAMGRAREIGTVQIDVGNAERFAIKYVDSMGQKRFPVILHTAIIGTIERFMYLIMDRVVKDMEQGSPGTLPYWLSPEQIRLLPLGDEHIQFACALADDLEKQGIRAGVDDRSEKVSRKLRDAHEDWVPLMAVIGNRELEREQIELVDRARKAEVSLSLRELSAFLRKQQGDYPLRPLYYPRLLSMRPGF